MRLLHSFERLDRRWIFLVTGLLVLIPLLFPLALPVFVSPPAKGFAAAVDKLPNGSTVLSSSACRNSTSC